MELDSLIQHFFGVEDPSELTEGEFERGLERLKTGFGIERDPSRRFALWVLLEGLGQAPLPAEAFAKEPKLRAAAEDYLSAAFGLERFGE